MVVRARIILASAAGDTNIHHLVDCSAPTVSKWRGRWAESAEALAEERCSISEVLSDAPRCGTPGKVTVENCVRMVAIACDNPADYGRDIDLWSLRELRLEVLNQDIIEDISERHLRRILNEAQIQPHKVRYWLNPKKDSEREAAIAKICEVYQKAAERMAQGELTVSVDEMTGVQAKERIFEDLAPKPARISKPSCKKKKVTGRRRRNKASKRQQRRKRKKDQARRIEHEYKRHGTLCLLAAWIVAEGKAFGWCNPTRKEEDFVSFIKALLESRPGYSKYHIVLDNLNTHLSESLVRLVAKLSGFEGELGIKGKSGILENQKTRAAFLRREENFIVFHYTPKHCSWVNQIEIWFSILARKLLRTASFKSVEDLEQRILGFIDYFNRTMSKPFKWMFRGFNTSTADS